MDRRKVAMFVRDWNGMTLEERRAFLQAIDADRVTAVWYVVETDDGDMARVPTVATPETN